LQLFTSGYFDECQYILDQASILDPKNLEIHNLSSKLPLTSSKVPIFHMSVTRKQYYYDKLFSNAPVTIFETSSKGRGVISTRKINKGDIIWTDAPIMAVSDFEVVVSIAGQLMKLV
jgi:hypothetical protein